MAATTWGPAYLDRELSGQNRPNSVAQAAQEAAGSAQRRLALPRFLCTSQVEKPGVTGVHRTQQQ